jgi:hypothetical protein
MAASPRSRSRRFSRTHCLRVSLPSGAPWRTVATASRVVQQRQLACCSMGQVFHGTGVPWNRCSMEQVFHGAGGPWAVLLTNSPALLGTLPKSRGTRLLRCNPPLAPTSREDYVEPARSTMARPGSPSPLCRCYSPRARCARGGAGASGPGIFFTGHALL